MMIIDGHLDLAYSALDFNRDLTRPIAEIWANEEDRPKANGTAIVTFPDLIAGGVGIVFSTLFVIPQSHLLTNEKSQFVYDDRAPLRQRQEQAYRGAMRQLDYYHQLADNTDRIVILQGEKALREVEAAMKTDRPKIGLLIHMEGADPIRDVGELELWYERGLRSIGLAWSDTRYATGQWNGGDQLTADGEALLERMSSFNMILDITHLSEKASLRALERYQGAVAATHCNARALVGGVRHLSDVQIRLLAERGGVMGVVFYNKFLRRNHERGDRRELVGLDRVVAQIDYVCQLLGSADHIALGTDFEGGFGREDIPHELSSARDLPQLIPLLKARGYEDETIAQIMGKNWLRLLKSPLQLSS